MNDLVKYQLDKMHVDMENNEMVTAKAWEQFRETGLLLVINQVLHLFGWSIVVEINSKGEVTKTYPARVKFRGFDGESIGNSFTKVINYVKENADELIEETKL